MKALAEEFVAAGCGDVQTFIQSGNVIFSAPPGKDENELAHLLGARLAERFGYRRRWSCAPTEELRAAIAHNPYVALGAPEDLAARHVPDGDADAGAVREAGPRPLAGDEYRVIGREIFLRLPSGMARTKLTNAYFDTKLGVTSTARTGARRRSCWS